ncbi:hypothetical protein [Reyranella sp.]|uniref:hypothetical protein n=1 Tax=Reyranella sp. TaxID=1929291 RepID=UPI0012084B3F|nr:hypothetical protein [Reyranella sp.]TAJ83250.1 MAG: hypothetical protein EPO50_23465 [Reyranella sp.]
MTSTIAIVLAVFSAMGGVWGWRVGTRNIQLPPERYDFPGGMSRGEYLRRLKVRHQRRRILLVLGFAVAAGVAGLAAMTFIALLIRR